MPFSSRAWTTAQEVEVDMQLAGHASADMRAITRTTPSDAMEHTFIDKRHEEYKPKQSQVLQRARLEIRQDQRISRARRVVTEAAMQGLDAGTARQNNQTMIMTGKLATPARTDDFR